MKRLIFISILMAAFIFSVTAQSVTEEPVQSETQSDHSEKCRVTFQISDSLFTNLITCGNATDAGVKIATPTNSVGFKTGLILRESFLSDKFTEPHISFTPYAGLTFGDNEILAGVTPTWQKEFIPYFAYNHFFNFSSAESGKPGNWGIKFGVDWYVDVFNSDDDDLEDAIGNVFATLFSIYIPKINIGVSYQIGKGF